MAMNYSVFKLQQTQGGKPETIPKNDRKFGYKKKSQRFPVRRFPGDSHHIETDMVSLTPDEPQPPPKPAKNFIKRNKEKIAAKNKQEPAKTVTLTQEQLNAILKSVGNVAGGSEHAVKISIDKASKDRNEILIESPRRHDRDDSDYEDHRRDKKHSRKKEEEEEEGGNSIYSFLDNQSKQKTSKEKKSRKDDYRDDEDDRDERETRKRRQKSRRDEEEEDNRVRDKNLRNRSRHYDDDDDDGSKERRRRNKSKHRSDDDDDDNYDNVRRRRNRSKRRDDSDYEEDIENRAHERKERIRKSEKDKLRRDSKERQESRDKRDSSFNDKNESEDHVEELPSPREKIGLPMDLSWRHMTKAEKRRLEIARQKVIDEEERKEEDRIRRLNARYGGEEEPKLSPQRHKPPRSDPATRLGKYSKGRDTETSNYTDGYRRGRRSNSPEERRSRTPDRSPEIPSHHSPYSSPKVPPLVPKGHMTLAEKKRLEWERDRVESVQLQRAAGGNTEPWGRPGAGAPLRTRSGHVIADYKGRQVRKASYAGKVMMMY